MLRRDVQAPMHGGRLAQARAEQPNLDWLDLSTGLNPQSYPQPNLDPSVFQRLPEPDSELNRLLSSVCHGHACAPTSGTQAVIEHLPLLFESMTVGVQPLSYAEHAHCWQKYGHRVVRTEFADVPHDCQVAVVVNPNNPTGNWFNLDQLERLRSELVKRGGLLIVDEAFLDTQPERTALNLNDVTGLLVLRSFGKFFGLAGIRAGYMAGDPTVIERLNLSMGPWNVSGPAQAIMRVALADLAWQSNAREYLHRSSQRLDQVLSHRFPHRTRTDFFVFVRDVDAAAIDEALRKRGILVRTFPEHNAVRFGIPADSGWSQLEAALNV